MAHDGLGPVKPRFTVNSDAPVQQLAGLESDFVAVLYEGSAAALNSRGVLVWKLEAAHVALVKAGHSAVLLEPEGGGTQLTAHSTSSGGFSVEDLFIDRAACGVGSAIGAGHGLALACGRRLLLLEHRQEVQREISLPIGGDPAHLCWAGRRLLACSTSGIESWHADDDSAAVALPDGHQAADATCMAASPSGTLLAAGLCNGQVLVWKLAAAGDSASTDRLLYSLPHNAAVDIVEWDAQSQQLAVSDGATVSLWTIPADRQADSTADLPAPAVCCGHQPLARITALAFDAGTPTLATGADHGQVLVYDTAAASPGAPLQPRARATVSSFADCCSCRATALAWLPSGALAAGCDDGRVVSWPGMSSGSAVAAAEAQPVLTSAASPAVAAAAAAPRQELGSGGSCAAAQQQQQQLPQPPMRCSHAESSLAAARRSAAAALAAATQVHGAAASQQQRHPLRRSMSLRSASAPQGGGGLAAVMGSGPPHFAPQAGVAATNDVSTSSASSQQGDSSATTDEQQLLQESPVRSVLPAPCNQRPLPPCTAAGPPAGREQPQPPKTPPSARGSRPKRGNRRSSSNSQSSAAESLVGSHGSNPDFLRRQSNGGSLANGVWHALSAPSTPQRSSQQDAMNGHWSPGGMPEQSGLAFGMYMPGPMQMPMHYPPGSMAMHPSPGHSQHYMAAAPGQVAYMQSATGPVPVYMPAAMPMGGPWVPCPPTAYGGYYHQGYVAAQQSSSWHASPPPPQQQQPFLHSTPPMSPSATSADFTYLSSSAAVTSPAPTTSTSVGTAGTAPRGRISRRGSRGRKMGANLTSPEGSSVELSDGSSSLKMSMGEADAPALEVAVPVTTIYVGNLSHAVDEHMLHLAFSGFGTISACEIVRDRMNAESRGFGFITFAHASCAASAMVNMAGAVLGGPFQDAPLKVAPSTRDRQAQMQQASVHSSLLAASASQARHTSSAANGQPRSAAGAANGRHPVLQAAKDSASHQNGTCQQPGVQQQNGVHALQQDRAESEDQDGPETLEQLQNERALTPAQQQQMQLSAAKQQFAAEQRQRLVDRARQAVADAGVAVAGMADTEAAANGAADLRPPAAVADAEAAANGAADPMPSESVADAEEADAEAAANGDLDKRPPPAVVDAEEAESDAADSQPSETVADTEAAANGATVPQPPPAVADAEAAANGAADAPPLEAVADAEAAANDVAEPRPQKATADAEAEADGMAESQPLQSPQSSPKQQQQQPAVAEAPDASATAIRPGAAEELVARLDAAVEIGQQADAEPPLAAQHGQRED